MSSTTHVEAPGDAELISAVRGGDTDAYGLLFERHVEAARRLARQLVSAGDVEDLVSEAFVKVLQVLQRGGGPDVAFRAYLLTAVRRLRVDRLRATSRLHTTDDMEMFDPGVPFRDTAVEGFESATAARAFASLPERWQLVLWHTEVEGQKPADVAAAAGDERQLRLRARLPGPRGAAPGLPQRARRRARRRELPVDPRPPRRLHPQRHLPARRRQGRGPPRRAAAPARRSTSSSARSTPTSAPSSRPLLLGGVGGRLRARPPPGSRRRSACSGRAGPGPRPGRRPLPGRGGRRASPRRWPSTRRRLPRLAGRPGRPPSSPGESRARSRARRRRRPAGGIPVARRASGDRGARSGDASGTERAGRQHASGLHGRGGGRPPRSPVTVDHHAGRPRATTDGPRPSGPDIGPHGGPHRGPDRRDDAAPTPGPTSRRRPPGPRATRSRGHRAPPSRPRSRPAHAHRRPDRRAPRRCRPSPRRRPCPQPPPDRGPHAATHGRPPTPTPDPLPPADLATWS